MRRVGYLLAIALLLTGCGDDDSGNNNLNNNQNNANVNQNGNADGGVECTAPEQCPVPGNECLERTCVEGQCGTAPVAEGTPVASQTAGDCRVVQCDGAGDTETAADASDLPVDGNPCTEDVCTGTTPSNPNVTAGVSCGTDLICNGSGQCVGCLQPEDCPGTDTDCQTRTCDSGTCGMTYDATGTAVSTQTAGDCHEVQCDGSGGTTNVVLDTDLPVDGNPCTSDVCTTGTPSNPPVGEGTACSANGGSVCNSSGQCVGCVDANRDCPAALTECAVATCTDGTCGFTYDATDSATTAQVPGDCHVIVCTGGDATRLDIDDSDLPDDTNDCTADLCSGGTPSNPPLNEGTACGVGGAGLCNDHGNCVECNAPEDCPGTDDDCQSRTCVSGTCGMDYVAPGTPVSAQTAGDCREVQCDGTGGTTSAVLDTDLPDDGNDCTDDLCTNGTPSNPPISEGTACSTNGGSVCNSVGVCVECVDVAKDCPAAVTECAVATCVNFTCGFTYDATDSATATQIAGDCKTIVCTGGDATQLAVNDADLPVDGNDCTDDVCTNGTPSNPPPHGPHSVWCGWRRFM